MTEYMSMYKVGGCLHTCVTGGKREGEMIDRQRTYVRICMLSNLSWQFQVSTVKLVQYMYIRTVKPL